MTIAPTLTRRSPCWAAAVGIALALQGCRTPQQAPPTTETEVAEESPVRLPEPIKGVYAFRLNGSPYEPRVFATGDPASTPAPGDVAIIDDMPILLGEPGTYDLRTTDYEDGRLLRATDGGRQQVIAFEARTYYGEAGTEPRDTLGNLSDADIPGLLGLSIDVWSPQVERLIARVDPLRTCISLSHEAAQDEAKTLPALPEALRCLAIRESMSPGGFLDLSGLSQLPELRYLHLRVLSLAALDGRWLQGSNELRHLILEGPVTIEHSEGLSRLARLQSLHVAFVSELDDLSFVSGMQELRRLDVSSTKVRDLGPVSGLGAIEWVNADMSAASSLPRGTIGSLRDLRVMLTKIDDEEVARFSSDNPTCKVWHRWHKALKAAVGGATRLRVRTGGTCHRDPTAEQTLAEEGDGAAIVALVDHLEVDEPESGFHCMCCGAPTLEFYRGTELVASVGIHHGTGMRWPDGWPADAKLTSGAAEFLAGWLKQRGVPLSSP